MDTFLRALSETERRVLEIIEPVGADLGYAVVRVRVMGSKRPRVQVMAERIAGGMDVEDCARLSRAMSPVLDVEDPIPSEYTLEVSSPGIDRPLTRLADFNQWVGQEAKLEAGRPIDGRRRFSGVLLGEAGGLIRIRLGDTGQEAEVPFHELTQARLVLTDALIDAALATGEVAMELDADASREDDTP